MKELFAHLVKNQEVDYLVDTCFFYYAFDRQEKEFIEFCKTHKVGITSFNVEEVLYHAHDVNNHIRERIRHALKEGLTLILITVDVSPGKASEERSFVQAIDGKLLEEIPDPSDAVLAAMAVKLHASILTRDKHHLFTTVLENYFHDRGVLVFNKLPR